MVYFFRVNHRLLLTLCTSVHSRVSKNSGAERKQNTESESEETSLLFDTESTQLMSGDHYE